MKYRRLTSVIRYLALFSSVLFLLPECHVRNRNNTRFEGIQDGHIYKSIFGEKYYATGGFLGNQQDSVESGLWMYTNLDSPLVIFGNFSDGIPIGEWSFVFDNGPLIHSQWNPYRNTLTTSAFSLPFPYDETFVDSNYYKLTTINDSLGKISIIVGIRGPVIKEEDLAKFGPNGEIGLTEQGYTFRSIRKEIKRGGGRYFFTEYFMKDSANRDAKLYDLYGYSSSKRHFVEFGVFHRGPKEDLVKIVFNLMATNLYVGDERFYNPYLN